MRNLDSVLQPPLERNLFCIREGRFNHFLPPTLFVKLSIKVRGGITIQQEKKYYNQKDIISEIHNQTNCSTNDITRILNSLSNIIKEKFSNVDDYIEIKLFPGLKVTSKYVSSNNSVSKRLNIKSDYSIFMSAIFTDDFRKKIRELHKKTT